MKFISAFAITLLFGVSLHAAAPSWTMFHGLNGHNISSETGLLDTWPEDGPKLLWKTTGIGNTEFPGYSTIVAADGRVYTTGNVKVESDDKSANAVVFCLDEKTGDILWKYDNGPGWTGHYPGDRSTPTLDGDRLYALSAMGRLVCLNAKTGEKIWDRNLPEEYEATLPKWAYAESVVIDGDKLLCWPGGKKASVVALDKRTGKTIWETPGSDDVANYATALIFEMDGRRMYANMNQKGLLVVDATTGKRLLFYEHLTKYDINATIPYYFDGKMLITSGYESGSELLQLTFDGDKLSAAQLWANKKLDNQHGGVIILDGIVYGSAHHYKKGTWMAVNLADGEIQWEAPGVGQGCCSFADGMLYCMGEKDGTVGLVKPTAQGYEETGRFMLPETPGMAWAHPVICGKKLFLRYGNTVYCFNVSK